MKAGTGATAISDILLKAVDTISDGRSFVEAAFLASQVACAEQDHRNAIAAACDAADKKLNEAVELIDRVRLASRRNGDESTAAPQHSIKLPPDFHARLRDVQTRISTIELALGCIDEECSHGQIGDVRRQALLTDNELGELLRELNGGDKEERAADV